MCGVVIHTAPTRFTPVSSAGSTLGEAPTEQPIGCWKSHTCSVEFCGRKKEFRLAGICCTLSETLGATVDMHKCNACQHAHPLPHFTAYGTLIDLFRMHHS